MRAFFFLISVPLASATFAQTSMLLTEMAGSLTLSPNAIINVTVASNATAINYIDIKNTGATTKVYGMKRYSVTLNTNGTFSATPYFIYNATQYPPSANASASQLTLTPGQSASSLPGPAYLAVHLDEIAFAGFSQVKYTVFNTTNTSDSLQIIFNYNASTSVREQENNLSFFNAYVDNANDIILDILSNQNSNADLSIQNINGSMIMETKTTLLRGHNKEHFSTNNIPGGIYFMTLKSADVVITRKLLIN